MESFSVKAYLQATDNNFVKTFNDAAKQVENFQKNTNSTMSAVGKVMTSSGKAMTKMVTLPIVGMGVAAAKVGGENRCARFEVEMAVPKAIVALGFLAVPRKMKESRRRIVTQSEGILCFPIDLPSKVVLRENRQGDIGF